MMRMNKLVFYLPESSKKRRNQLPEWLSLTNTYFLHTMTSFPVAVVHNVLRKNYAKRIYVRYYSIVYRFCQEEIMKMQN